MKERPILYEGPLVQAILEDRKNQTRRLADRDLTKAAGCPHALEYFHREGKWVYCDNDGTHPFAAEPVCRYGQVGDRLWVKETFQFTGKGTPFYRADFAGIDMSNVHIMGGWKPSIFMPRSLSRILLEITDVRIQRLQDISDDDALAEGITGDEHGADQPLPVMCYQALWDSINSKRGFPWEINPWVWAISFKRIV